MAITPCDNNTVHTGHLARVRAVCVQCLQGTRRVTTDIVTQTIRGVCVSLCSSPHAAITPYRWITGAGDQTAGEIKWQLRGEPFLAGSVATETSESREFRVQSSEFITVSLQFVEQASPRWWCFSLSEHRSGTRPEGFQPGGSLFVCSFVALLCCLFCSRFIISATFYFICTHVMWPKWSKLNSFGTWKLSTHHFLLEFSIFQIEYEHFYRRLCIYF